jgi:hypothetical protein
MSEDSFYSADTPNNSNHSLEKTGPEKQKRTRRRNTDSAPQKKINPWGPESYSDLILKALESAPNGRLQLNQIYSWFIESVPFFGEKSSPEER